MAVERSATSRLLDVLKAKFAAHTVFESFNLYDMADLDDDKYPSMPFIAMRIMGREPGEYFERSIRGASMDVLVIFNRHTSHPHDASLAGWEYAEWLAEEITKFINTLDLGADPFIIERDCQADATDTEINNDLAYMVTAHVDLVYETEAL